MLKGGHVYDRFTLANGKKVSLRVLRWEDLDGLLSFINTLVKEKRETEGQRYTRDLTRKSPVRKKPNGWDRF